MEEEGEEEGGERERRAENDRETRRSTKRLYIEGHSAATLMYGVHNIIHTL